MNKKTHAKRFKLFTVNPELAGLTKYETDIAEGLGPNAIEVCYFSELLLIFITSSVSNCD